MLAAGTRLGPYEILAPLGAGGMGEVYRARDPRLGRQVAIKILPPDLASDPERLCRFEQEARAASSLSHPHILAVFDFRSGGGLCYLVTELLEGETLRARLAGGALPPAFSLTPAWASCLRPGRVRQRAGRPTPPRQPAGGPPAPEAVNLLFDWTAKMPR